MPTDLAPAAVDPRIYREMGLTDSEFALIVETLGRQSHKHARTISL